MLPGQFTVTSQESPRPRRLVLDRGASEKAVLVPILVGAVAAAMVAAAARYASAPVVSVLQWRWVWGWGSEPVAATQRSDTVCDTTPRTAAARGHQTSVPFWLVSQRQAAGANNCAQTWCATTTMLQRRSAAAAWFSAQNPHHAQIVALAGRPRAKQVWQAGRRWRRMAGNTSARRRILFALSIITHTGIIIIYAAATLATRNVIQ